MPRFSSPLPLILRGLVFTALAPAMLGLIVPRMLTQNSVEGWWQLGWIPIAAGATIYLLCLASFLNRGGTPAIFFTRHLRFAIGEEPQDLASEGLYRYSRNPMYVGVVLAALGHAILFRSAAIAAYTVLLFGFFQIVITRFEEPHLRVKNGSAYLDYCRRVRRWL